MVDLVLADPVSLIAAGVSFLLSAGGITIGATAAKLVAGVLLVGALAGANLLLAPRPEAAPIEPSDVKTTIKGEQTSEINAIGRVRLGGVLIFGNTYAQRRVRLLAQCKGVIDAIENTYLGGQEVALSPDNGFCASPPWAGPAQFVVESLVFVNTKPGTGTETAWPDLITFFPSQWTADHRVRGIGQVLTQYLSPGVQTPTFLTLFQGGEPPTEQVVRAAQPYDPRDGVNRWTDNGIICALHVLLTWPEFSLADFDLPFIAAEADKADALVAINGGGTEKRSRCSGIWLSETPRVDVMRDILQSVGAELVPRPFDLLGIALIDDAPSSELTLPGEHTVEFVWRSGPESVERPNLVTLFYYSPERQFEMAELDLQQFDEGGTFIGPPWARVQSEIDAYGEKPFRIDLRFCPSASQAQRIARQLFALARADRGVASMNWIGLAAWGARRVTLEKPDGLGNTLVALLPPRVDDSRGVVELSFVEWPVLSAWNPAVDEVAAPDVLPDVNSQLRIAKPATPSSVSVVGGVTSITIDVPGGAPAEANYRTFDAVTGLSSPWLPMNIAGASASINIDLTGVLSEFRSRQYIIATDVNGHYTDFALSPFSDVYRVVVPP